MGRLASVVMRCIGWKPEYGRLHEDRNGSFPRPWWLPCPAFLPFTQAVAAAGGVSTRPVCPFLGGDVLSRRAAPDGGLRFRVGANDERTTVVPWCLSPAARFVGATSPNDSGRRRARIVARVFRLDLVGRMRVCVWPAWWCCSFDQSGQLFSFSGTSGEKYPRGRFVLTSRVAAYLWGPTLCLRHTLEKLLSLFPLVLFSFLFQTEKCGVSFLGLSH